MNYRPSGAPVPGLRPDLHAAYLRLIETHFGLRLAGRQAALLDAVIPRLLARTAYADPADLLAALDRGQQHGLLDGLAAELTVGETHFFRGEPQIAALRNVVLPDLVQRRAEQRRLRLWSAGCSTGEEPYTLAILLRDLPTMLDGWDIDLLGTDINAPALEAARQGCYGAWSFRGTPATVRQQYFVPEGTRWRLSERVRAMVRFAHLNLALDAFPAPGPQGPDLDLIVCRNVTLYFSPAAAARLYRHFARALAPGGWLLLGPSDPTPMAHGCPGTPGVREDDLAGLFEPVVQPGALLWRRAPAVPAPVVGSARVLPARGVPPAGGAPRRSAAPEAVALAAPPRAARPPLALPVPRAVIDPSEELATVWTMVHRGARGAAREHAARLAQTWPVTADAHLVLGMLDLDEGAVAGALERLRRATFLDKDNALAHFALGRAYGQQGNRSRARAAFTHARR